MLPRGFQPHRGGTLAEQAEEARIDPVTERPVTGEFPISQGFAHELRFGVWCGVVGVLFVAALFLWEMFTDENGPPTVADLFITVGLIGFFALLAWYLFAFARKLPNYAVLVNDDGIWLAGTPAQNEFVHWDDVRALRERVMAQRLELLDANGQPLIKVEYQVEGYARLLVLILERTRAYRGTVSSRRSFRCALLLPAMALPFTVLCAWSAWYFYQDTNLAGTVFCGFGVVFFAGILASAPLWLRIHHDRIVIAYPLWRRAYSKEDIQSITFDEGRAIKLLLSGEQAPVTIGDFNVSGIELYEILWEWLAEREAQ